MDELLGVSASKAIDVVIERKEERYSKVNNLEKRNLFLGYHNKSWNITQSLSEKEQLEKIKTYTGTTLISSLIEKTVVINEETLKKQLFQKDWFFSMKGEVNLLKLVEDIYSKDFPIFLEKYIPETDSEVELVFSIILEGLSKIRYNINETKIADKLSEITEWIEPYGKISFLLSDGKTIFAFRTAPPLYYRDIEKPLYSQLTLTLGTYELKLITSNLKNLTIISSTPEEIKDWKLMERGKIYCFCEGVNKKEKEKIYWR